MSTVRILIPPDKHAGLFILCEISGSSISDSTITDWLSYGDEVRPWKDLQTSEETQETKIYCNYSLSNNADTEYLFWYQQKPGRNPRYILHHYKASGSSKELRSEESDRRSDASMGGSPSGGIPHVCRVSSKTVAPLLFVRSPQRRNPPTVYVGSGRAGTSFVLSVLIHVFFPVHEPLRMSGNLRDGAPLDKGECQAHLFVVSVQEDWRVTDRDGRETHIRRLAMEIFNLPDWFTCKGER
ncbi:UNVERIFIED_CONTAM: hypothetical protein FKN15_045363 [Acipenser sinensis]